MERYEDSFLQAGINTVDQLAQISTQSVRFSSALILSSPRAKLHSLFCSFLFVCFCCEGELSVVARPKCIS